MGHGILLAVPFAILLGGTLFLSFRFGIAAEMFFTVIEKLLVAGNRDRALKLCAAAGRPPVARVVHAGLQLQLPGTFASEDARADAAVEALMPVAEAQTQRFMSLSFIAIVGVLGAIGTPMLTELDVWLRFGAPVALLAASANHVRVAFKLRRDTYAAVGVIAPFVQGDVPESYDA